MLVQLLASLQIAVSPRALELDVRDAKVADENGILAKMRIWLGFGENLEGILKGFGGILEGSGGDLERILKS